MTNTQTIAGAALWMFTALGLLAATLEPVSASAPQPHYQLAAHTAAVGGHG